MKLTRIRLQNFRSHTDTTLDLPQIALVLGRNNAGKSSLAAAIEFALTGKCQFTDGRGAGANALVRNGAEKAAVELDIEGLGTIRRTIPGGLEVSGWAGNQTVLQAKLYETLGTSETAISAAINTSRFLEMKADERKSLLFGLLGFTFTFDTILDSLGSWAASRNLDEKGLDDLIHTYKRIAVQNGVEYGPEVFAKLEKDAIAERRAAKRALSDAEGHLASLPPVAAMTVDVEGLRRQLASVRTRQEELSRQVGAAGQAAHSRERLEATAAQCQAKLAEVEGEYKTRDLDVDQVKIEKCRKKIITAQKKRAELDNEHADLVNGISELKGRKTALNDLVRRLGQAEGRCPLAPELITCQAGDRLRATVTNLRGEVNELDKQLVLTENRFADINGALNDLAVEVRQAEAAMLEQQQKTAVLAELRKRSDDAKHALERTQAELASLPPAADTAQLEAQLVEAKTLVQQIETELAQERELARTAETRRSAIIRVEAIREEVQTWDQLCDAFGPKGIKSGLIGKALQSLEATVNERLALLTGGAYSTRLNIEDGFEVLVTHDDATVPLDKLSTSERLRVGVVVQTALVDLAGVGLLLVDDADTLDLQNRALLTGMLLAIRASYNNVLVLSTVGEVTPRDPGIPGVGVFVVESGRVRRVPAAATA